MTLEETFWEVVAYLALAIRTVYQDKEMLFWALFFGELYFFYKLGEYIKFKRAY